MRSAMKPEAMRLMMPKPSISDSISAPRAGAVAEVGAIGDDVHLRHRHGDAAGDAGDAEQREQHVGRDAERRLASAAGMARFRLRVRRQLPAQHQQQRQHGDEADACR